MGFEFSQIPVKIEFPGTIVGVPRKIDTLALVCPDPMETSNVSILVGTNTSMVKRLFESCQEEAGEHCLSTLTIHPVIKEAYETLQKAAGDTREEYDRRGTVWFTQRKTITLQPGRVCHITGAPKFPGKPMDPDTAGRPA